MLFKSDMYEWQMQSAKQRFGNWFVMMYGSDNKENSELKGHPYLDNSGKAGVVNYVYDNNGELIKGKVLENSGYSSREAAELIAEKCGAEVVQVIGSKFVLYKKNEDEPKIVLPKNRRK
jgi:RNA-binding protein YhbY